MTHVILAEKGSAARKFAQAFGGTSGTYKGTKFQIVAASGHIFEFKEPHEQVDDDYVQEFKSWDLKYIPWNVDRMSWKKKIGVDTRGGKKTSKKPVFDTIKRALDKADTVVIATDVDPSGEGQMIAWEIIQAAHFKGTIKRLHFEDESVASLQKAWDNMQDLDLDPHKDGEYMKADARSKWDFLSMQIVRLQTGLARDAGYPTVVYGGRLKSVIVKLVGDQEEAIRNYVKKPYFEVKYKDENGHIYGRKFGKDDDTDHARFDDKQKAEQDKANFADPGTPVEDARTRKSTAPGKMLDLAAIGSILAVKGFKPSEVSNTYQKMYEAEVVSYPRTDDKKITIEQFNELKSNMMKIASVISADATLLTHLQPRKTHIAKGMAHGANRPGPKVPTSLDQLQKFGKSAVAIYELVAKSALMMFGEDYIYDSVKAHIKEHKEFETTFSIPIDLGFKGIFDSSKETSDDYESDEASVGIGSSATLMIHEGANKKPPRPTMKWLEMKLAKYNVGTGATRLNTIPQITSGKYALMDEKKALLSLTQTGKISWVLLDGSHIGDPGVTEKLNNAMDSVAEFKTKTETVMKSAKDVIIHDKKVFMENQKKLQKMIGNPDKVMMKNAGGKKQFKQKEKVSGKYLPTGEEITFTREFGIHKFTQYQVEELLNGNAVRIPIALKKGGTATVEGKLAYEEYKGKMSWKFKPDFKTLGDDKGQPFEKVTKLERVYKPTGETIAFKETWGKNDHWEGHTFTDKQIEKLLNGDTIAFEAISKKNKKYTAKGQLGQYNFKGSTGWGFQLDFGK